jgi:tetrapyrrole methylase family protein/MazG family protein
MRKDAFMVQLEEMQGIEKLVRVVAQLRHPTEGCPWDLKQTHHSLKPYMLEEAYEAVEAVDEAAARNKPAILMDELGDVLLQVVLHAQLAKDAGHFDFEDVCETIADKLIRRHPHVFADVEVSGAEAVVTNWEAIKRAEKGEQEPPKSILEGVSKNQPALSRALETSKRAVKVGFEWPSLESLWDCVMSEFEELRDEIVAIPQGRDMPPAAFERLESEMGDIFFASVNLARHFRIDPETALTKATAKFTRRFQTIERLVRERFGPERALESLDFQTWDDLWNEAKTLCAANRH